jgi:hypothetical protein
MAVEGFLYAQKSGGPDLHAVESQEGTTEQLPLDREVEDDSQVESSKRYPFGAPDGLPSWAGSTELRPTSRFLFFFYLPFFFSIFPGFNLSI